MKTRKTVKVPFNTEKDVLEGKAVEGAPIVGGEFVIPDAKEGEIAQGQTIQVQSDKHLEDDLGVGNPVILRAYGFAVQPEMFAMRTPTAQELFDDHKRGISALLWQDGLSPIEEVEPRVVLSLDKSKYFIIVAAKPQTGQVVLDTTLTLSQIANDKRTNPDKVHRVV